MAKLWDYYDGEPFMENPHLAVIGNPFKVGSIIERKKSGFRKISQRKGKTIMAYKKRRGRKNSPKRRRRNPFPTAGIAINRPRKRRKNRTYHMKKRGRTYSYNPRRRGRKNPHRRHRRNPAVLGIALPPMHMILYGAGGFLATPVIESYVNPYLPASITGSTVGRYAVKIGVALGLTYLAKHFLSPKEAYPVAIGASVYVLVSAAHEFLPQITGAYPTAPVQAYRTGMIKAYRTGMIGTGVNGYTNLAQSKPGLAYLPSDMMPRFNINTTGMQNPTWSDPRFTQSPFAAR